MRKRWLFGLVVAVGLAASAAGLLGGKALWIKPDQRDPAAARIARDEKVFDTVWTTIDRHYYAPDFDHARWRRLRDVYRPRIRTQTFEGALYINVLANMLNQIGTSHVAVSMPRPRPPRSTGGPKDASTPALNPVRTANCGGKYLRLDLGFDLAEVRRGRKVFRVVTDLRRGSNAELAGVAPGDVIEAYQIAGRKGLCPAARMRLRAPDGARREVAYEIEDHPARAEVLRADLPSGVRVLRFEDYDRKASLWLAENLKIPPARGLVLDLRGNHGGKIWVMQKINGFFLQPGAALGASVARGREKPLRARATKTHFDGPLVVLIGPGSASAAEITAYALRHHRRARLVGTETAGAVLTSRNFRLPDGGAVTIAVADYQTPDGKTLEAIGVTPDRSAVQTLEALRTGRDLPLEAAERAILTGDWRP